MGFGGTGGAAFVCTSLPASTLAVGDLFGEAVDWGGGDGVDGGGGEGEGEDATGATSTPRGDDASS